MGGGESWEGLKIQTVCVTPCRHSYPSHDALLPDRRREERFRHSPQSFMADQQREHQFRRSPLPRDAMYDDRGRPPPDWDDRPLPDWNDRPPLDWDDRPPPSDWDDRPPPPSDWDDRPPPSDWDDRPPPPDWDDRLPPLLPHRQSREEYRGVLFVNCTRT